MPNPMLTKLRSEKKDLTPNAKFAIAIGAQLFVGLLGVAVTAGVTILLAGGLPHETAE